MSVIQLIVLYQFLAFYSTPAMNRGPLLEIMLSGSPCNFHTLSQNNFSNPSADVFSVIEIKCTILVNLLTTTKIESYP